MTSTLPNYTNPNIYTHANEDVFESLIEVAWLVAAIVVPLVFNQQAMMGFGFYKAKMLQLLAAVIISAWAIKVIIDRSLGGMSRLPSYPVRIGVVGLLGWQLLATLFSVNPRASFWGGLETSEGLPSAIANVVLFLAVTCYLRHASQVDRLVSAIIATSIPVALYALIQRVGFDPVPFIETEGRAFSTMGHPIYLAAYLLMVMPLTWWKIVREMRAAVSGERVEEE